MSVPFQPAAYHTVVPYLIIKGAAAAIDFYKQVLGAVEGMRILGPDGCVGHAEIKIGDSTIMLADEFPNMGYRGPKSLGGTPVNVLVYVPDADATFNRAIAAGAEVVRPVANQFYGDRSGMFLDPFGHSWSVATHVEDVPHDELMKRAAAMGKPEGS
jgi:PhnB protein